MTDKAPNGHVWRDQFQKIHDAATLLACPACGAAVAHHDTQRHADWHNDRPTEHAECIEPADIVCQHTGVCPDCTEQNDRFNQGENR